MILCYVGNYLYQMQERPIKVSPVNSRVDRVCVALKDKMNDGFYDPSDEAYSKLDVLEDEVCIVDKPLPLPQSGHQKIDRRRIPRAASYNSAIAEHGKTDGENRKWLLSAVRRIREQKQRSNIARIMNQLRMICPGRFSSPSSVSEQLEQAVQDGELLRVGPPSGDCSYRDPVRVVKLKSHSLDITEGADLSKVVVRAVRDLADPKGSSASDVQRYIRSSYALKTANVTFLENAVVEACKNAVSSGKLRHVVGDEYRYLIVAPPPKSKIVNGNESASVRHQFTDRAFSSEV